jgi:hypothetical protein
MIPVTTVGVAVDVGVGVGLGVGELVVGVGVGELVVGVGVGDSVVGVGVGLEDVGVGLVVSVGPPPDSDAVTPIAVGLATNGSALLLHTESTAPRSVGQVNGV